MFEQWLHGWLFDWEEKKNSGIVSKVANLWGDRGHIMIRLILVGSVKLFKANVTSVGWMPRSHSYTLFIFHLPYVVQTLRMNHLTYALPVVWGTVAPIGVSISVALLIVGTTDKVTSWGKGREEERGRVRNVSLAHQPIHLSTSIMHTVGLLTRAYSATQWYLLLKWVIAHWTVCVVCTTVKQCGSCAQTKPRILGRVGG